MKSWRIWILGALAAAAPLTAPVQAQAPSPMQAKEPAALPGWLLEDERNTISVFQEVSEAVVYITTKVQRRDWSRNIIEIPSGTGSGFVWDDQGHIVTNYHVIMNQPIIMVTLANGETYQAEQVGIEPNKDIAVLHIDADPASLRHTIAGDSDHLLVGQKVLAVGNPFGLDQTLTTGVISALGRTITSVAGTRIEDVIQTDASINPGNSGGPLLDSSGHLIGMNTAIQSPTHASAGVGFAVPVSTISRVVPQLIEFGRIKRVGLGVQLLPDDMARRWGVTGLIVQDVVPGFGAAKAGLHSMELDRWGRVVVADVIVGIDDTPVRGYADLYAALEHAAPGDVVTVSVVRGREHLEFPVELRDLP